jgi:hypothetical protein
MKYEILNNLQVPKIGFGSARFAARHRSKDAHAICPVFSRNRQDLFSLRFENLFDFHT